MALVVYLNFTEKGQTWIMSHTQYRDWMQSIGE